MPIQIVSTSKQEVTKIACPNCGERVKQIGLRKDSVIDGLSFKCKKCGLFWEVKTTNESNKA